MFTNRRETYYNRLVFYRRKICRRGGGSGGGGGRGLTCIFGSFSLPITLHLVLSLSLFLSVLFVFSIFDGASRTKKETIVSKTKKRRYNTQFTSPKTVKIENGRRRVSTTRARSIRENFNVKINAVNRTTKKKTRIDSSVSCIALCTLKKTQ